MTKYSDWLDSEYSVTLPVSTTEENVNVCVVSTSSSKRGRPSVPYEDSSASSKRRKNIMVTYGFEHIYEAYLQALRSMGKSNEGKLVTATRSFDAKKYSQYCTALIQKTSTCTICRATPRQMNNLNNVKARPEDEDSFQYGLSTLHA
ncbi:hypothetical protein ACJJTC_017497 [Scirpophaga incertulas]